MDQVGSEGTAKGHPRVRPPQQEAWSDREDKGGAEQTASSADDRSFIALTPPLCTSRRLTPDSSPLCTKTFQRSAFPFRQK